MPKNALPDESERIANLIVLLLWEGRLKNGRLQEVFGLSSTRASEWLRELRDSKPSWVKWNTLTRSYHATAQAYLHLKNHRSDWDLSLEQYIARAGSRPPTATGHSPTVLFAGFPTFATPNPQVFGTLNRAIQIGLPVEITYCSMQHPDPHKRVIRPHTLVRTERRWHVRAYCELNRGFRDYNLGRISDIRELPEGTGLGRDMDAAWSTTIDIQIAPHPQLTAAQERVIRDEYFPGTAARRQPCRAALVHYFIQSLHAATDIKTQLPPEYQLAIVNIEELRPWLLPE